MRFATVWKYEYQEELDAVLFLTFMIKNNYMEKMDVILLYPCAMKCRVLHQWFIDKAKRDLSEKAFNLEYLCVIKSDL